MINVTNSFKKLVAEGVGIFQEYVSIVLQDGTVLTLTNKDIWNNGLSTEDAVSRQNQFDIGSAIVNKCVIVINNIYNAHSSYDFYGADVTVQVGLTLPNGTVEKIQKGRYTVADSKYNGSLITLTCYDFMAKFDKPYSLSQLSFPTTIENIFRDACSVCGVQYAEKGFQNSDVTISEKPNDDTITFRDMLSWCAQIACCFCRCNAYGQLEPKWFEEKSSDNNQYSGGTFLLWDEGNTLDEGTFSPWNEGDIVDGGTFFEKENFHRIASTFGVALSTDDIVITGVKIIEKNSNANSETIINTYFEGADGYVISIEDNPLIADGTGAETAKRLASQLIGFRFRKASFSHLSDPTIEAGDIAYLAYKEQLYPIIISSTKFTVGRWQKTESSAQDPAINSAQKLSQSIKNYVAIKQEVQKEKKERDVALENLNNMLQNSSGLFSTAEQQQDGSTIYYAHNKASLGESNIVIKFTAEAIGISSDGGKTYPYGIDMNATAILNRIYTVGLDANYINTGSIVARDADGNITFSLNMDTGAVNDRALAEFKNYLGEWIRITGGTLELGRPDDPLTLVLKNNRISFNLNGVEVAWLSNNLWSVDNIVIKNSADLCGIKIRKNGRHRHIG